MDTTGFNRRYHLEHSENSPEISEGDSPRFAKIASTSSSKRSSRRGIQKRVVSVEMKDVEGLRVKADQISAPPSDSWAWRKYGQKPIKGSPYPRGYYRCSSSKGCPARKQVERSRADPKMLLVTYYCEHNHSWPLSKTKTAARSSFKTPPSEDEAEEEDEEEVEEEDQEEEEEKKPLNNILSDDELVNKFSANLGEGLPIHNAHEFGWFADLDCTSCSMFESPMLTQDRITTTDTEMPMIFTMRDEDDSLFADLGELPECSAVLRRGMADQRRPTLATTS